MASFHRIAAEQLDAIEASAPLLTAMNKITDMNEVQPVPPLLDESGTIRDFLETNRKFKFTTDNEVSYTTRIKDAEENM